MILIIDNYDSFTYNLYQNVAQFYPQIEVIRHDKITVNEVKKLNPAGIILSPGPGRPEDAGICIELIQNLGAETALLGVCLGHQALVCAFGGRVIQAPEIVHGKKDKIFHVGQGLYEGLPLPFEAGRYHSLMADRNQLPDVLRIESQNASGLVMGLRHAHYPFYGVQFHPESILTPAGNRLLKNFIKKCETK